MKSRKIYIFAYIFIAVIFLKAIYKPLLNSFFENDLLWFVPTVSQSIQGLSLGRLLKFLFDPNPLMYGIATLKIYTFLMLKFFGPIAEYFIFTSVLLHFGCSFLLFYLCKQIGLDFRIGFFSAVTYLTLFAHYGAYIWPMASQHILVVFFILLVFNLYLRIDAFLEKGVLQRGFYILTLLANLVATFCRISIIILPVLILGHILLCSRNNQDRVKKYFLWLPLFATYLLYPLITLTYVGDNRINIYLARSHYHLNYLLFFSIGLGLLFLFGRLLRKLQNFKPSKKMTIVLVTIFILFFYVWLCSKDIRNSLLPYNIMVPFMGITMSFLTPLQNVLLNNSARPLNFIYLQLGVFSFLFTLFFVIIFVKNFALNNNRLFILIPWYIIGFMYINLRNPIAARYFIYISPLFSLVFSSALVYILSLVFNKVRLKPITKEIVFILIFTTLCIPNALAINLNILRNKLVNNFFIYDYIKIANIIDRDVAKSGEKSKVEPKGVYVDDVFPVYSKRRSFCPVDPKRYDNFRFAMACVFKDRGIVDINVNTWPPKGRSLMHYYTIEDGRLRNSQGLNLDKFDRFFEDALTKLGNKDYEEARNLFQKAIRERPFLLNYLLPQFKLEDLKWIINGPDLRSWIKEIVNFYEISTEEEEKPRVEHIATILNNEINSYIQCLFYTSYIDFLSGNVKESESLFSQIQFLESDYERLYELLSQTPILKSEGTILSFLKTFDNVSLYSDVEYKNTYEFERFLFKLIFGVEFVKYKGLLNFRKV